MVELADIFRDAGAAYLQRFGDRMLPSHRRVLKNIIACRTPALGGQRYLCRKCGHEHTACHSCRDRHCPICQGHEAERWLDKQRALLLPCDYGFATCTVPEGLRKFARSHQRLVYSILLRSAALALIEVASDRHFVGGLTGVMAVLHTWSQMMIHHPHVHILFPIGGLGEDGSSWIKPRHRRYILPDYALAKVFRENVERAFRKEGLYERVPREVWWEKRWVAHIKRVGSGEKALLYLSRYVFRIAISNERIVSYDGYRVTFKAKDQKGRVTRVTLGVEEFIRRYLQHVLPKGFVKVRYFGLWASASRDKLVTAREILEHHLEATGRKPRPRRAVSPIAPAKPRCPRCGAVYEDPPTLIPRSREPP